MKKLILLSFGIVAFVLTTQAQSDYKNAIGGRIGTAYYDVFSGSFKTFITKPGALEFNLGVGGKSYRAIEPLPYQLLLLINIIFPLVILPGLNGM